MPFCPELKSFTTFDSGKRKMKLFDFLSLDKSKLNSRKGRHLVLDLTLGCMWGVQ